MFGGVQAVSQTQKQQMIVMMLGMLIALVVIVVRLPDDVSLGEAVQLAGALDRMNAVSLELDLSDRYNMWSGLLGGSSSRARISAPTSRWRSAIKHIYDKIGVRRRSGVALLGVENGLL